ncbi:MogA/MoaB family molybdenum cofactor biosynthesis protein [Ilumatobacter sp.]|uniref:MogA/MoaB family molybdenum cofactor biosynthesis protein n=1 Tax=Ilumatobacter sp. TaxID=1967498 RepID=UPI003B51A517
MSTHEVETPPDQVAQEAKVLTCSDGVVHGTREDRSGEALAELLTEHGFTVVERRVTEDGADPVAAALAEMTDGFAGLVVTTGGTGFAPRDQTPEGTRRVIERDAPGIAEAMRLRNPLGRLSRGVAGVRGRSIVVNTPGSTSGCVEQLGAVIDVLPHALRLLHDTDAAH